MGDNVYLGDRNGVRTPMQWNPDRNAGFSRANPASLYSPVIMDPVWGYEALNVEAQQSDPSSLLNWMRNMIALRKLFSVFGRGTLEFLAPPNRKILAYVRNFDDERILCVTNLSRYAQPVDLDLAEFAGQTPVEMLGYVEFPRITAEPYRLTLGPYGFFWLELHDTPESAKPASEVSIKMEALLDTAHGWAGLIPELEKTTLPEYLPKQRWFGGKSRQIHKVRVVDWAEFAGAAMMFLEVSYESDGPEEYFAPFLMHDGVLQDALQDDTFCWALLTLHELPTHSGMISGKVSEAPAGLAIRRGSAEQSNSSIIFGDQLILKLFRRQQAGLNPDIEIGRYLTGVAGFDRVPPFQGSIEYRRGASHQADLAIVQGLLANEGDGWTWTTEELERYYEISSHTELPQTPEAARDHVGAYVDAAGILGKRTAELHLALAAAVDNPAFAPEPFAANDIDTMTGRMRDEATRAFALLKATLSRLPDNSIEMAGLALGRQKRILDRLSITAAGRDFGKRIRIHGDYHLGQVLRTKNDFVILDFEGEPARPLEQRRGKYTPLKDVAGMLRSFSYAANSTLITYTTRHPEDMASLEPWARLWEQTVSAEFLSAYRNTVTSGNIVPAADDDFQRLLDAGLLEKAMYELTYELNNDRPGPVFRWLAF